MKNPVFYQIFVQSFRDSNGDGIGDIGGVTEKLPYIKGLGVDAIWLTPICCSPMHDNGYDVADYYNINPLYGGMTDVDILISAAHSLGLKIVLDLVVNHTSTEHEWFKKSCQRIEPYSDYYIWRKEPNDWHSIFGGSSWHYNEERKEYYLHLFTKDQADLNWEKKTVREEVKRIIFFWAAKGIDGFRLDVINLISKEQSFRNDKEGHGAQYYIDGPRILEYIKEIGSEFHRHNLFTVGELFVSSIDQSAKYSKRQAKMLSSIFSLKHLTADWPDEPYHSEEPIKFSLTLFSLPKMKKIITEWQEGIRKGDGQLSHCWGNHDQPRIISRFGCEDGEHRLLSAKMLATGQLFLPGVPFIFQGEEIAMANYPFSSLNDFTDVESLGAIKNLYNLGYSDGEILKRLKKGSREHSHTAMQWNSSLYAGFTDSLTGRRVNPDYKEINADQQIHDENSVYHFYRKIIALRKGIDGLDHARYESLDDDNAHLWSYYCQCQSVDLFVLCNFSDEDRLIKVKELELCFLLISNYRDTILNNEGLKLRAYEAVVFKRARL